MTVTATGPRSKADSGDAKKRTIRPTSERIADLEAKIARMREREQKRLAKPDPAIRHLKSSVRALDRALGSTESEEAGEGIRDARDAIADVLDDLGAPLASDEPSSAEPGPVRSQDQVLTFLIENIGQTASEIAEGLRTDVAGVRDALSKMKALGELRTEGRGRGMRYYVRNHA